MSHRYYVADEDGQRGPFELSQLPGSLKPHTLVWREGTAQWVRAEEMPELRGLPRAAAVIAGPAPAAAAEPDWLICNPSLPKMARLIVVYALLVNPAIWLFDGLSCAATTNWDDNSDAAGFFLLMSLAGSVIGLVTTILLVIGGLKLRALKASGPLLIQIGVWINLAMILLVIILMVAAMAGAGSEAGAESVPETPVQTLLNLFSAFLGLLTLAFEVIALVWLIRHRQRLAGILGAG